MTYDDAVQAHNRARAVALKLGLDLDGPFAERLAALKALNESGRWPS
jgi:hypothetical protein